MTKEIARSDLKSEFLSEIQICFQLPHVTSNLSSCQPSVILTHPPSLFQYGYYPNLQYHNGKYFPPRPDNYPLQNVRSYSINDIQSIEYRIREAIDSGYVYSVSVAMGGVSGVQGGGKNGWKAGAILTGEKMNKKPLTRRCLATHHTWP